MGFLIRAPKDRVDFLTFGRPHLNQDQELIKDSDTPFKNQNQENLFVKTKTNPLNLLQKISKNLVITFLKDI